MRTKLRCCVSVGVNARKSCSPSSTRAFSFSAAKSTGRGHQSDRLASNTERSRRRQIRNRYDLASASNRAWKSSAASSTSVTATSSGSTVFNASAARAGGGPPSTSTETTFASACTPVSVRPATASSLNVP